MKKLVLSLLFIVAAATGFAQAEADSNVLKYNAAAYDSVVGKLKEWYNLKKTDSLSNMYSDEIDSAMKAHLWNREKINQLMREYGKMNSFRYIGEMEDKSASVYKVRFSKSVHAMTILLDKKRKILSLRMDTSSEHIDKLMKE